MLPLVFWDCGFEYHRGQGSLPVVSVVCCQEEVSAMRRSLVQRSPTDCGVSKCDLGASIMRRPWPIRGEKINLHRVKFISHLLWFYEEIPTYMSIHIILIHKKKIFLFPNTTPFYTKF